MAYQVAATTLTALGKEDAAFTAIERSLVAVRQCDDPDLETLSASTLSWVFTKQGRLADAERVALACAQQIEPGFRSRPEDLALWGVLVLRAATAAVRQKKHDTVKQLLRMANGAAESMGAGPQRLCDTLRADERGHRKGQLPGGDGTERRGGPVRPQHPEPGKSPAHLARGSTSIVLWRTTTSARTALPKVPCCWQRRTHPSGCVTTRRLAGWSKSCGGVHPGGMLFWGWPIGSAWSGRA
ncbi:hypothetical protein ACWGBX_13165 [Streptomyces sp. NPDC055037]